jgi:hypothetical protein
MNSLLILATSHWLKSRESDWLFQVVGGIMILMILGGVYSWLEGKPWKKKGNDEKED